MEMKHKSRHVIMQQDTFAHIASCTPATVHTCMYKYMYIHVHVLGHFTHMYMHMHVGIGTMYYGTGCHAAISSLITISLSEQERSHPPSLHTPELC